MPKQFTIGRNERLKSRKQIEQLFAEGKSFVVSPFRIYFDEKIDVRHPILNIQFGIGVSSKNFKRAVDRNSIKRRIREAYRLNKNLLPGQNKLAIAYIYSVKEILPTAQIQERLVKTFKRLEYVERN